jgi:uncharacterized metal-binding protein YceD (DUF177 family)
MSGSIEFSRPIRTDSIGAEPRGLSIEADETERAALAKRFGLVAIARLVADVDLARIGNTLSATGRLEAQVTQSCVASGDSLQATIDVPFRILFAPPPDAVRGAEEEIELSEQDCDVVFYQGDSIDVGEAAAETLSLSLDPWPRAPGAEEVLKAAGVKSEEQVGPFAALAALKDKLK